MTYVSINYPLQLADGVRMKFLEKTAKREVTVFKRKNIRKFVAALLGMAAGMSLTTTIIPTAITSFIGGDHFEIRFLLADYFAHTALFWGTGGWAVGKIASPRYGAIVLGSVGAISGLLLGIAALGGAPSLLIVSVMSAVVYGAIGGMIISGILPGDDERLMINFDRNKAEP